MGTTCDCPNVNHPQVSLQHFQKSSLDPNCKYEILVFKALPKFDNPRLFQKIPPLKYSPEQIGRFSFLKEAQYELVDGKATFFIGQVNQAVRVGIGKMVREDGFQYQGMWEEGRPHGEGRTVHEDGRVVSGTYDRGILKKGKMVLSDGSVYYGELSEAGWQNGTGVETYLDGSSYQGGFVDGKKEGFGRFRFLDDKVYQGGFKAGRFEGQGRLSENEQPIYEGEMKEGLKDGEGVYYYPNGSVYKGSFLKDQMHGRGLLVLRDGVTLRKHYEFGKEVVPEERIRLEEQLKEQDEGQIQVVVKGVVLGEQKAVNLNSLSLGQIVEACSQERIAARLNYLSFVKSAKESKSLACLGARQEAGEPLQLLASLFEMTGATVTFYPESNFKTKMTLLKLGCDFWGRLSKVHKHSSSRRIERGQLRRLERELAAVHGVPAEEVLVQSVVENRLYYEVLGSGDQPTLSDYLYQFHLSKRDFDARGDFRFTESSKVKFRGGWPYFQPFGCVRYGLSVKGQYDGGDDGWLQPGTGQWAVAYHGISMGKTKSESQARFVFTGPPAVGTEEKCLLTGESIKGGIVVGPNVKTILKSQSWPIRLWGEYYRVVLQCRVRPSAIRVRPVRGLGQGDSWVVAEEGDVRAYGLLVHREHSKVSYSFKENFDFEEYRARIQCLV